MRLPFRRKIRNMLLSMPHLHGWMKRRELSLNWRLGQVHDEDFLVFRNFPPGLCVDIGANSGQSALSFRQVCPSARIVSFEANTYLERDLKFIGRLLGNSFEYHMVALSDKAGTADLFVPYAGKHPITQAASLSEADLLGRVDAIERNVGKKVRISKTSVQVRRFDDYGFSPVLVKIDVEGGDVPVVRGMMETLNRCHPVILMERSPHSGEVMSLLQHSGYNFFDYHSATNTLSPITEKPSSLNYVAVPASMKTGEMKVVTTR